MERMPSWEETCGFSSTLSLAIFTLPAISLEISSRAGPIMRQGPHHLAQKSSTTGSEDCRTSCAKLASVTLTVAITSPLTLRATRSSEALDDRAKVRTGVRGIKRGG